MPRAAAKRPWNKGKSIGQMKPLTHVQVQLIKKILEAEGSARDLALFAAAIDTMLRGVDLLRLKVEDVTDKDGQVLEEFTVRQQKTGKGTLVGLSPYSRDAIASWIAESGKFPLDFLFTGTRKGKDQAITTDHFRTLVKRWVALARLDPRQYSSHSLRRTKAALIYENTRNIEVVRELLGQSSVAATSAYLNVGKKRALEIARRFEI